VIPVLDPLTSAATSAPIASRLLIAGGWAVAPVGVEFASVAPAILGLMVALIAGLAWASIRVLCGRRAVRWTHTWGCGIRLTPAMEYTATGFVQPIKRIFSLVYQPTVKVESEMLEESRYFAKRRRFAFRIEPVFERYLYQPVVDLVQRAGERARAVQAGSLHLYLAYIFLTLIAILLIGR